MFLSENGEVSFLQVNERNCAKGFLLVVIDASNRGDITLVLEGNELHWYKEYANVPERILVRHLIYF